MAAKFPHQGLSQACHNGVAGPLAAVSYPVLRLIVKFALPGHGRLVLRGAIS
jgi:hypothetical protein